MESTVAEYIFSLITVYGGGALAPGIILAYLLVGIVRDLRLARAERRKHARMNQLESGPALLVGKVESDDPKTPVVAVRIEQRGREYRVNGGQMHSWTEIDRKVRTKPFRLLVDSNRRAQIVPGERPTLLRDDLRIERRDRENRILIGEIQHGDRVIAEGILERDDKAGDGEGYRGGARSQGFVLKAAPGSTLTISTQPLETRFLRRIRLPVFAAILLLALVGAVHVLVFKDFHRLSSSGVEVTAKVISMQKTGADKGGNTYVATLSYKMSPDANERQMVEYLGSATSRRVNLGDELSMLLLPSDPSVYSYGKLPTASPVVLLTIMAALFFGAVVFNRWQKRRVPWYERTKILEERMGSLSRGYDG